MPEETKIVSSGLREVVGFRKILNGEQGLMRAAQDLPKVSCPDCEAMSACSEILSPPYNQNFAEAFFSAGVDVHDRPVN